MEHLRLVRELFDKLIEVPAANRAELIAQLQPANSAVAREVQTLLDIHDRDVAGLEAGPAALMDDRDDDAEEDLSGKRVGSYRIEREIGRGGMGAVYEARRDDTEYEQRVAVKLIKRGLDGDAVARRFRHERQILAALDHPNIARLLDGGMTSDRRPFLVMEFIDGVPIDQYCDEHRLDVQRRIQLFLCVCDAVDHAHTNLVVHRDLKPANILVSTDGSPKLLDFGIAKLVTPEMEMSSSTMTAVGMRFFTPEYASPEQIRGEAISTRSDVYSLGVILYQLLSGQAPFKMEKRSEISLERLLAAEVSRPSTLVTEEAAEARAESRASQLRKKLAGELDNIIMMALRKEPSRRYSSVEQMADDLRRYLAGRPILATRDTSAYRLRRFVSRHKGGVLAAGIAILSVIGGVGGVIWQAVAASEAARRAEVESAQAQQATRFITTIFGSADPGWTSGTEKVGPSTTVLEAIQRAASHVSADLHEQPEVEATIRRTIGNTYQSLGLFDSAETQLASALAIRKRVHPEPNMELARDLYGMGVHRYQLGSFAAAESLFTAELAVFHSLGDDSSVAFANAENNSAAALAPMGKLAAAESLQTSSLSILERRLGNANAGVANEYGNVASLRARRGDLPGAERLVRKALGTFSRLHGRVYPEQGLALLNLGVLTKWQGKYAVADSALRQSERLLDSLGLRRPTAAFAILQLAHTHYMMGNSIVADSEIKVAKKGLLGGGLTAKHVEYIRAVTVEAQILTSLGRAGEGERLLREVFPSGNVPPSPHDPRTAEVISALGRALAAEGKLGEAKEMLASSYSDMLRAFGPRDARTRWAMRADSAFRAQMLTGRVSALPR